MVSSQDFPFHRAFLQVLHPLTLSFIGILPDRQRCYLPDDSPAPPIPDLPRHHRSSQVLGLGLQLRSGSGPLPAPTPRCRENERNTSVGPQGRGAGRASVRDIRNKSGSLSSTSDVIPLPARKKRETGHSGESRAGERGAGASCRQTLCSACSTKLPSWAGTPGLGIVGLTG